MNAFAMEHKKEELRSKYQQYILMARAYSNGHEFSVAVDITFWFDEVNCSGQNMAQWIFSIVDKVNIMAYRDKAEDIIAV